MSWRRPSERTGVLTRPERGGPARSAPPPGDPPSAGVIGPRGRRLPQGRAVLGGLLIAAAAVLVFAGALASASGRSSAYVVAARPLAAGTIIAPGDDATETFTLPSSARTSAFRDVGSLMGRTLAVAVTPGELIQSSMLAPSGGSSELRPVSITVDPASLAGLSTGDPVDVLAAPAAGAIAAPAAGTTGGGPTGSASGSPQSDGAGSTGAAGGISIVVRGAALLSVSHPGSALAPVPESGTVVTLGVSSLAEAELVVQAAHAGTVILIRAEPSDGIGPGPAPAG